jgi:N6-adenosine-specific RNA methylase IME4
VSEWLDRDGRESDMRPSELDDLISRVVSTHERVEAARRYMRIGLAIIGTVGTGLIGFAAKIASVALRIEQQQSLLIERQTQMERRLDRLEDRR